MTPITSCQLSLNPDRMRLPMADCGSRQTSRAKFSVTSGRRFIEIAPGEVAPGDDPRAERRHVAGRNDLHAADRRKRPLTIRLAFDIDRIVRAAFERKCLSHRRANDARQRFDLSQDLSVCIAIARSTLGTCAWGIAMRSVWIWFAP